MPPLLSTVEPPLTSDQKTNFIVALGRAVEPYIQELGSKGLDRIISSGVLSEALKPVLLRIACTGDAHQEQPKGVRTENKIFANWPDFYSTVYTTLGLEAFSASAYDCRVVPERGELKKVMLIPHQRALSLGKLIDLLRLHYTVMLTDDVEAKNVLDYRTPANDEEKFYWLRFDTR